jgi:DNA-binding LacI/PurR family transcriptional regulator
MRHNYGVSHRTLRRALDELVQNGLVVPYHRTYRVAHAAHQSSDGRSVLFVARGTGAGSFSPSGPRTQSLFLALERECAGRGLRLLTHAVSRSTRVRPAANRAVLGSVVWAEAIAPPELAQLLPDLPAAPVAVVLQGAAERYRAALRPSDRVQAFSVANSSLCGERVGAYLRGLGHRAIVYLSPIFGNPWAQNRLAGLKGTFEGDGRRVVAITREHLPVQLTEGGLHSAYAKAYRALRAAAERAGSRPQLEPLLVAIDRSFAPIIGAYGREYLYEALGPLFRESLAVADATAWVTHNDVVGIRAQGYLRDRHVAVPERLSLVGFDNTPEASEAGLTSYDFNLDSLARVVVDYVVGGTIWRRTHTRGEEIEVEGTVVERVTSGHAAS